MVQYRAMSIIAERQEDGTVLYKVVRHKMDGTASTTPWGWKSIECAESYVRNHGF